MHIHTFKETDALFKVFLTNDELDLIGGVFKGDYGMLGISS